MYFRFQFSVLTTRELKQGLMDVCTYPGSDKKYERVVDYQDSMSLK